MTPLDLSPKALDTTWHRTLDNPGRSDLVEGAKRRLRELARTPSRKRLIDVTTTGTFGYHHRHDLPVVAC